MRVQQPTWLVRAGVVAATLVAVAACAADREPVAPDDNSNGTGVGYRDAFYGVSGGELRDAALGRLLDRDVPFQDAGTDLREIRGVDPATAVAAYLPDPPWAATPRGDGWWLASPDADLAADPWTDPALAQVLRPRP